MRYDYYYINASLAVSRETFLLRLLDFQEPAKPSVEKTEIDKYGLRPHTHWFRLPKNSSTDGVSLPTYHYEIVEEQQENADGEIVTLVHHILVTMTATPDKFWEAGHKLSKAKQQHFALQFGSEVAEMRQNLTIVSDAVRLVIDAYKAFAKGDISKAARLLKVSSAAIASPYLFYKFGIKPIFESLTDLCNDLQRAPLKTGLHHHSARSRVWEEVDVKKKFTLTPGPSNVPTVVTITCRLRAISGYNSDSLREINYISGLEDLISYLNPVRVAWELIPYSFVIDYFVGVSQFLGAYNPDYTVRELYNSTFAGVKIEGRSVHVDQTRSFSLTTTASTSGDDTLFYVRTPTSGPPVSGMRFTFDLSTMQLIDIAALLLQKLGNSKLS